MKYIPGLMVGQLSGSSGSTTASHNRNGSYFRTRTIPTNPSSSKQAIQRNNVTELAQNWKGLAQDQRDAWTALGTQMVRQDPLGGTYTLTGMQAYTALNRSRRLFGLADLSDAPTMPTVSLLTTLSLTAETDDSLSVAFTPTPIGADTYLVIRATAPVSAGKTFMPRSAYKDVHYSAANAASPADIATAYVAAFGSLATQTGAKIFIEAALMTLEGFMGTPIKTTAIVAAAPPP